MGKPLSIYPDTYSDLPVDTDDWGCSTFITYHKRNKIAGGDSYAYDLILRENDNLGWWNDSDNCNLWNCAFRSYFKSQGFEVGGILGGLLCAGSDASSTIEDVVQDTGTAVVNTSKAALFVTKPIVLLPLIGIGLYYLTPLGKAIKKSLK